MLHMLIRAAGWLALIVAVLSAALLAVSGPGYQMDWWTLGTALQRFLRWGVYGLIGAGGLGLLSLVILLVWPPRRGLGISLLAVIIAAGAAYVPVTQFQKARSVPPIHDITTDTEDPPLFDAILPLREGAPNPAGYAGGRIAEAQRQAYPDIRTLFFTVQPGRVFDEAVTTVNAMGWEVVDVSRDEGRIEAYDTTFWFGFVDDVVIRVRPHETGAQLDIRSKSRVGRSDVGANAERIRAFREKLQQRLSLGSGG